MSSRRETGLARSQVVKFWLDERLDTSFRAYLKRHKVPAGTLARCLLRNFLAGGPAGHPPLPRNIEKESLRPATERRGAEVRVPMELTLAVQLRGFIASHANIHLKESALLRAIVRSFLRLYPTVDPPLPKGLDRELKRPARSAGRTSPGD